MAASSQFLQNKRGRDDYWMGGFALRDAKRTNSGVTLAHQRYLFAFPDKIDYMDESNSNTEDIDAVNEVEGGMNLNGVIKSIKDETGLKAQTDHSIESTDENGSADHEMGSVKQGELTADGSNSEATSLCDIGDHLTYYEDVSAELGFFVNHISPDEFGIIINYIYGDSMANIMYSDAVHSYSEPTEVFCVSLWEDDICLLNEHPIIQNDFESSQQTDNGLVVSGVEIHDVWNDNRQFQRVSDNEKGL